MKTMKRFQLSLSMCMGLLCSMFAQAGQLDAETKKKAMDSVSKGAAYLIEQQNPDGSWGRMKHPAIAALCIMGINNAPGIPEDKREAAVSKGLKFVAGFVQEDGSIFPAKVHKENPTSSAFYPNYTTSIALLCFATVDRKEYVPMMRKARAYLRSTQFQDPNTVDFGGIGYGKTKRADLSNGGLAAEALYFTEHLDREPYTSDTGLKKQNDEMWAAMADFITKVQNLPETNKQPYVSKDPRDLGGMFYRPNESKAGSRDGEGKTTSLISSGSMTYVGLKTLLYAKLKPTDPRVTGAMDYLMRNYVLTENPGMGKQGLYYYLHVMTRALRAYGQDELVDAEGNRHLWRNDVIGQIVGMQNNGNGSWVNENARFMESDPILTTAYALISLKDAAGTSALTKK